MVRARTLCAVRGCRDFAARDSSRCERHRRRNTHAWRAVAEQAIARAGGRCERCTKRARLSAHHVRPLIEGGVENVTIDEVLALCASCQALEAPSPERRPEL